MKELAVAMHKAQGAIEGAKKGSVNPGFRSKYADLGAVWDACRDALQANGLVVNQFCRVTEAGALLVTRLMHTSGEFIEGEIPLLNTKGDMQGLGSALTYARRYGLAAMVGVCPEDDDGNAASEKPKAPALPERFAEWAADFESAADNGLAALKAAWEASKPEYRAALPAADRERLKARAAKAGA